MQHPKRSGPEDTKLCTRRYWRRRAKRIQVQHLQVFWPTTDVSATVKEVTTTSHRWRPLNPNMVPLFMPVHQSGPQRRTAVAPDIPAAEIRAATVLDSNLPRTRLPILSKVGISTITGMANAWISFENPRAGKSIGSMKPRWRMAMPGALAALARH